MVRRRELLHICNGFTSPSYYFMIRALFLLVILSTYTHCASAQLNRQQIKRNNNRLATYTGNIRNKFGTHNRYFELGLSFNTLNYFGDLAPAPSTFSTDIGLTKPAVGLSVGLRIGPRQSIQSSLTYGSIHGADQESADPHDTGNGLYRYQRNLSFRNRITELSVVFILDLLQNKSSYIDRAAITPYVFGGIAVFHHNPQALVPSTDLNGNPLPQAGTWVNLRPLGTEGQHANLEPGDANYGIKPYKLIQPAVPLGIGVRIRLANQFNLASEIAMRYLFTDYLDDVSRNYVDLGVFGNNELAKALSYRSNELATADYAYTSPYDGNTYHVLRGYGSESKSNVRGNKDNRDIYTVFTLRISYLLDAHHFRRPKYR